MVIISFTCCTMHCDTLQHAHSPLYFLILILRISTTTTVRVPSVSNTKMASTMIAAKPSKVGLFLETVDDAVRVNRINNTKY